MPKQVRHDTSVSAILFVSGRRHYKSGWVILNSFQDLIEKFSSKLFKCKIIGRCRNNLIPKRVRQDTGVSVILFISDELIQDKK